MPPKRAPTAKQLKEQLQEANARLAAAEQSQQVNTTALEDVQRQLEEQTAALRDAQAQLEAAEAVAADAAAAAATAAAGAAMAAAAAPMAATQHAPQDAAKAQQIPRPRVPKGKTLKIRASLGALVTDKEYCDIRYLVHTLVHTAQLEWQCDFRNQDTHKLSQMFSAAADAYPVLNRYAHHWATAAIAGRYMQNVRRYAREKGVMPKKPRYNRKID
ncbi:hypothetical protein C2E23DRAFT_849622 [Lenzites betulinus]|nr:hypothetical protein C2E23DRAFT_849622 [Lenzites betulinus]